MCTFVLRILYMHILLYIIVVIIKIYFLQILFNLNIIWINHSNYNSTFYSIF